ncbi:hypothetical protein LP414_06075 [Polaromonas sp. P1(28)-13]|nr:hypothetical protein LP414_06075 [Polaromonas sp. P1(28)-13]
MGKPAERSLGVTIVLVAALAIFLHMDRAAAQSAALVMEEGSLRSRCVAAAHVDASAARQIGGSDPLRRCGTARAKPEEVMALGVLIELALFASLVGFYAAVRASHRRS